MSFFFPLEPTLFLTPVVHLVKSSIDLVEPRVELFWLGSLGDLLSFIFFFRKYVRQARSTKSKEDQKRTRCSIIINKTPTPGSCFLIYITEPHKVLRETTECGIWNLLVHQLANLGALRPMWGHRIDVEA